MRPTLFLVVGFLAACGTDGPPIAPPPNEAAADTPARVVETIADRPATDGDVARPLDAADTTEEL